MKDLKAEFDKRLSKFKKPDKNVSREFQIFGYELAEKLGDLKNKSLYIKMAKELPRDLLERAYSFTSDYSNARSKAKIFMYKLKELRSNSKTANNK